MSVITHHVPDAMLAGYAAGNLPHAFAVAVASHVSLCEQCRVALGAHQSVGGAILEDTPSVAVSSTLKDNIFSLLDDPFPPEPVFERKGIFPSPVMEALRGREPRWKTLGMGVRQDILSADSNGSVRLLYIPPGQAVPDHSHNGLELTLVLQGSFSDETGRFGIGDLEIADEHLEHTPVADDGDPCICLASTDARLRFRSLVPRLLQPLFQI
ncbi:Anti-sigma-E factor ChrR [Aliiroseovarius sp. xm-m-379]|uniref:ChrR family anti-sigma-E factor n=1 Tax=unclassified Aliiroseovarius TaxID=2623558 RepID=UPI001569C038|nr:MULTISPECIES: ChrR family anti-sigma-E factor [unclassified Aliiroseovarius]NRP12199.1 Anti-sigma-E factor ChrR [Aliiroseovarius sp. xm-d-517]NRP25383.1 Anti-sigma-E factor ChrR [Aliiroseovarius sp. xm-m-379]NRP31902.1 Anti-sigma-E factor ChrR [Aliiroseovarius sp. xm-m-314]NRP34182.1 Anti-sigma-E factor ChrR [Aliiroseovarius sp. xm-a-104]NRP40479.1 Anti-sigma-E factor ChrR [Aliiroseovarius sp. xm-m-339-2]